MQLLIIEQLFTFMYAGILGVILGFAYDIFRILRMIMNSKNISIFIQDILYFVLSGVITFWFVLNFNSGDSRFYILAGEAIGWILYHLTVGNLIYKCSNKLVKCLKSKIYMIKSSIIGKISKKNGQNK